MPRSSTDHARLGPRQKDGWLVATTRFTDFFYIRNAVRSFDSDV